MKSPAHKNSVLLHDPCRRLYKWLLTYMDANAAVLAYFMLIMRTHPFHLQDEPTMLLNVSSLASTEFSCSKPFHVILNSFHDRHSYIRDISSEFKKTYFWRNSNSPTYRMGTPIALTDWHPQNLNVPPITCVCAAPWVIFINVLWQGSFTSW
jgi:hypothetical protein